MEDFKRVRILTSFLKVDHLTLKNKKGDNFNREVVVKQDVVCALVNIKGTDKFLFIKQWCPGTLDEVIELVTGTCDIEGESKEDCIKREIIEKLGYEVERIEIFVPEFYTSPGYTTEKTAIFYCTVKEEKISKGGGINNENIEVIVLEKQEMIDSFYNQCFRNAKTLMALQKFIYLYCSN